MSMALALPPGPPSVPIITMAVLLWRFNRMVWNSNCCWTGVDGIDWVASDPSVALGDACGRNRTQDVLTVALLGDTEVVMSKVSDDLVLELTRSVELCPKPLVVAVVAVESVLPELDILLDALNVDGESVAEESDANDVALPVVNVEELSYAVDDVEIDTVEELRLEVTVSLVNVETASVHELEDIELLVQMKLESEETVAVDEAMLDPGWDVGNVLLTSVENQVVELRTVVELVKLLEVRPDVAKLEMLVCLELVKGLMVIVEFHLNEECDRVELVNETGVLLELPELADLVSEVEL
ncbi:uncharacterized protein JN550_012314 [Neoarthrinium moseri]|uniref:uncharacterized protein n=1 Tax=Neoarthrinium moseri TaxID=1658444 RepID=UPI001FDBB8F5|nr:uncharacterized protein JN550_012314 [Neoarthrinium moseri]KAI1858956.1 hypothetical protein JN550_012314 [Neoarthrinium moseri]